MRKLWLNGVLAESATTRVDPADRGFTLGDGVFETIRAAGGMPLHAARHFARLRGGAALLGIAVAPGDEALLRAIDDVLRANGLAEAAVRITLSRGPSARGLLPTGPPTPTLLITAAPLPPALPPGRLMISEITRRNEFSPLSRIKSLNYLDSVLARQEAAAAGADDALLLNTAGHVAEATAANIFLLIGGEWITPPVADGALPGIARALLLEHGVARELRISGSGMAEAQAGFLANSLGRRALSAVGDAILDASHPALAALPPVC
jgi:branched-chain amino acid aminotransferase